MIGAYIVGLPGAGKSTAVKMLTEGLATEWSTAPFAHATYRRDGEPVAIQIGGDHELFSGTDRLSMSVQPKAIEWVLSKPAPVVFGEGDRLATAGFLDALEASCEEWWLIYLTVQREEAARRAAARGSNQNPKWVEGRRTKIRRLVEAYPRRVVRIDGTPGMDQVVGKFRGLEVFNWAN